MKRPGRPRTSRLPRAEQLRRAKQAQRRRERAAGLVTLQLKLPRTLAGKLAAASRTEGFLPELDDLLERLVIRIEDYPALADIAWNRVEEYIPAREAFALYERNWRFVDPASLEPRERALIARLAERFAGGLINA